MWYKRTQSQYLFIRAMPYLQNWTLESNQIPFTQIIVDPKLNVSGDSDKIIASGDYCLFNCRRMKIYFGCLKLSYFADLFMQCPVLVAVSHINMVSNYKNYDTQNATKLIMFNLENNKMTLMKKDKQKNNGNKTTLNT